MNPFGRTYYSWVTGVVIAIGVTAVAAVYFHELEQATVLALAPLLLLVVTLMELRRNIGLQRAAFIKDYVSQFFTNPHLFQTFQELIYMYENALFDKVEGIKNEQNLDKLPTERRPIFEPFRELQGKRQPGSRLYHPEVFQGSPEETRLDALLGYFDVVAYYYKEEYLRIEDIAGNVGYFLAVMSARNVILYYLKINREAWANEEDKEMDVRSKWKRPPFENLQLLLDGIQDYNKRPEKRMENLWGKAREVGKSLTRRKR